MTWEDFSLYKESQRKFELVHHQFIACSLQAEISFRAVSSIFFPSLPQLFCPFYFDVYMIMQNISGSYKTKDPLQFHTLLLYNLACVYFEFVQFCSRWLEESNDSLQAVGIKMKNMKVKFICSPS
jgi:hypothetical protein